MSKLRLIFNGDLDDTAEQTTSFFGQIWNGIKSNIGAIAGFLIGGPVGAALGMWLQSVLDAGGSVTGARLTDFAPDMVDDEYPINEVENEHIQKWFRRMLSPAISSMANKVDAQISIETNKASRLTTGIVANAIMVKANEVLKSISIIRAYNQMILIHGERINPTLSATSLRSDNYVINKVNFTEFFLTALEKAVVKFVDENMEGNYVLVSQSFTANQYPSTEGIRLDWNSKTVDASIQKYVLPSEVTSDQTEVEILNTDMNDGSPATTQNTDIPTSSGNDGATVKAQSNYAKWLLLLGAGYFVSKVVNKK